MLINDVFLKSKDPHEAEAILREMCAPPVPASGDESTEEDYHKLPPEMGEALFKKKALYNALPPAVRKLLTAAPSQGSSRGIKQG